MRTQAVCRLPTISRNMANALAEQRYLRHLTNCVRRKIQVGTRQCEKWTHHVQVGSRRHTCLSRSFADPAYLVALDHNFRWTSANGNHAALIAGTRLPTDRLASLSEVDTRHPARTGRLSSNMCWSPQYQLGGTASKGFSTRLLSRLPRLY